MKRIIQILFSLTFVLGMAACAATLPPPTEEQPLPEIVYLQITPAVEHWLPLVAECAHGIPNFGVHTQVLARSELSLAESDLILRLGERLESDPFVAIMGLEEIVLLAGEDVPISSLSLASLQAIYAGQIRDWGELPESDLESGAGHPITTLSYPEGHEIEILFRRAYLDDEPIAADPQVFLTIDFLQDLFSRYPDAIGYLLASQVPEGMQVLSITGDEPIPSSQYVLAITDEEPAGGLKQLLLCLQNLQ